MRSRLKETDANFMRKDEDIKDVKGLLIDNVAKVWIRATQPIICHSQIETKLKELLEKWKMAVKKSRWKKDTVDEI